MIHRSVPSRPAHLRRFVVCLLAAVIVLTGAALGVWLVMRARKAPGTPANPSRDPEAAGTIERDGARVEYPAGSRVRGLRRIDDPPEPVNQNQIWVSPAFVIDAERVAFSQPLLVTLPLDLSRMPLGARPEDVYPVLASGGAFERLDVEARLDPDKKHVTFLLRRLVPLVALRAKGDGSNGFGSVDASEVGLALDSIAFVPLESAGLVQVKDYTPRVLKEYKDQIDRPMIESLERRLNTVRTRYAELGFGAPYQGDVLKVDITNVRSGVEGFASGGNHIDINFRSWKKSFAGDAKERAWWDMVIAHEYFHLLQQNAVAENLATSGYKGPGGGRNWFEEATAEWMAATQVYPANRNSLLLRRPVGYDFGFVPLSEYESLAEFNPHQYSAALFFAYLASRYTDDGVVKIIKQCYDAYMKDGRSLTEILDDVLTRTPVEGGPKGLAGVYVDFLIAYYHDKKFEPLAGSQALGPPDIWVDPGPAFEETWTIDSNQDGGQSLKQSTPLAGHGYSALKFFRIGHGTGDAGNPDLQLRLRPAPGGAKPGAVLVVCYTSKADGQMKKLTGDTDHPVVIPSWQPDAGETVVLVVDASLNGCGPVILETGQGKSNEGGLPPGSDKDKGGPSPGGRGSDLTNTKWNFEPLEPDPDDFVKGSVVPAYLEFFEGKPGGTVRAGYREKGKKLVDWAGTYDGKHLELKAVPRELSPEDLENIKKFGRTGRIDGFGPGDVGTFSGVLDDDVLLMSGTVTLKLQETPQRTGPQRTAKFKGWAKAD